MAPIGIGIGIYLVKRRFTVIGSDPHRFDGDGDGIGCESGWKFLIQSDLAKLEWIIFHSKTC